MGTEGDCPPIPQSFDCDCGLSVSSKKCKDPAPEKSVSPKLCTDFRLWLSIMHFEMMVLYLWRNGRLLYGYFLESIVAHMYVGQYTVTLKLYYCLAVLARILRE